MNSTGHITTVSIGEHAGPAGRVFRLLVGASGLGLLYHRLVGDGAGVAELGQLLLGFAVLAAGYLAVWRLLERPVLARLNPWVTTALLLLPTVIYSTDPGGSPFFNAIALYMSLSMLTNALTGYGGTEVLALPTLVWGRRYPTYSPFTTVDLVERALLDRRPGGAAAAVTVGSASVASFVFLMFWLVPLLGHVPPFDRVAVQLPGVVALVLLLPAVQLGYEALQRRDRNQTLGAVTLAGLTPAFAMLSVQGAGLQGMLWGLITFAGLGVGLVLLGRVAWRQLRHRPPESAAGSDQRADRVPEAERTGEF